MVSPTAALIELEDIRKSYGGGASPQVEVLHCVSLCIEAGEFVAIVGASGSGKSTLMHLLGCLDKPTSGRYRFNGQDVAAMQADELAWLRREAFGFVFQGYHLIAIDSARENVEMPAIYAGMAPARRRERSAELLARLGLGERLEHRPNQLSGGQQQRVSIARALMNGGRIILADEPTGALDSHSGQEVMALFDELSRRGHTIILITHDRQVAARARRVIEIHDGRIVADSGHAGQSLAAPMAELPAGPHPGRSDVPLSGLAEVVRAAWRVMWANGFRTGLTLLGIVIGVASVIVMLAIGLGTRQQVVAQMGAFGTNLIFVSSIGESSRIPGRSITLEDLEAVAQLPNIALVLPNVTGNKVVRHGSVDLQLYVRGTGAELPRIQTWPVALGSFFTAQDEREMARVAVLGQKVVDSLMPDVGDPLGQSILIGNTPFLVIGVMSEKGALSGDRDDDNLIFVPFGIAGVQVFGQREPTYTVVAVEDVARIEDTQAAIDALLLERHGLRDVAMANAAASIAAQTRTQDSMTLMLSLIAAVSLVVGGIGVMNVMLMTVRERTREIGIRMATGARQADILRQFLSEAVLVSLVGGLAGVAVGLFVGAALILSEVPLVFSLTGILGAFGCALVTGLVFGYMPARQAARLDPVVALGGE
ncbi:MacB family efflux pump subunit [Pseudomonas lopnurensis]|uniref:MacB family efflux pump subunit n=1 Tax=Pseudomonas lopnurensis TaxID=1477517 RepID=UPI001879EF1F|nr:MacB family efflux pump subunit [Pseudomonas lopnurensis]MBE7374729.1 MacB family efflux pump subunit [Pseudomonas lopnurensis]